MFKTVFKTASATALAAATIMLAPQNASALNFTYTGPAAGQVGFSWERTNPPGAIPPGGGSGSDTGNSLAGAFNFTSDTNNPSAAFVAWCFDLDTTISRNVSYDYNENSTMLASSPPYQNPGASDRIQKLFNNAYDPSVVLSSATNSAGFQLAIWEVLYDTDGSLTADANNGGQFFLTDASFNQDQADAVAAANGFLADTTLFKNWTIKTYDSGDAQDVGVAIPLPAAAWLLLAASGGLIAAKRRHARRAA